MTAPTDEYLVQYGLAAFVGRFAAYEPEIGRGETVVVRTPRGVELGTVLCQADRRYAGRIDPAAGGELLRLATENDQETAARLGAMGRELLTAAEELAESSGLPLTFLDAEVVLEGPAILHAVAWEPCDATPLFAALSERLGRPTLMQDMARLPTAGDATPRPTTCGKPNCGSQGCSDGGCGAKSGGCSAGGCSRGAVKSADELTAYFAELRRKMEAARIPLT